MRPGNNNIAIQRTILCGWSSIVLILLITLIACSPAPESSPGGLRVSSPQSFSTSSAVDPKINNNGVKISKNTDCPALDSQLYQLSQVDDPQKRADEMGLRTNAGSVQVLILLESEDSSFLSDFGVEAGSSSGLRLQAFVPFEQLCALANHAGVLAVRLPAQKIP